MAYRLFIPQQAVGANLVYFDFFNATGSGARIQLLSVQTIVSGATAVTGVVGVDLFLTRTSAIGTGGTLATAEGTSLTAATIVGIDNTQSIPGGITARLTPSGGATAGAVIGWISVSTEETNAGTYTPAPDLVRQGLEATGIYINENSGVRVVQSAVASVGNIGFNVAFNLVGGR